MVALLLLAPQARAAEIGIASTWTTERWGRTTASGIPYRASSLTAAHKRLPFGTRVEVTSLGSGKTVIVKITDRGPYRRGRVIDLTPAAARQINSDGLTKVALRVLP